MEEHILEERAVFYDACDGLISRKQTPPPQTLKPPFHLRHRVIRKQKKMPSKAIYLYLSSSKSPQRIVLPGNNTTCDVKRFSFLPYDHFLSFLFFFSFFLFFTYVQERGNIYILFGKNSYIQINSISDIFE